MAPEPQSNASSTEARIVEAAHEIFLQKGLAGARMQEIADRAGINKALLHYYFRSKDKLFEFILTRALGNLLPRVMKVLESDDELLTKLRLIVNEYVGFVARNSYLPLFIINELNRNEDFLLKRVITAEKPRLTRFIQQVEDAVASGQIRPIRPAQLLMNVFSMCIFPFLARPMFQLMFNLDQEQYEAEMQRRRVEIAEFVISALRP